jgi:hypothetical protein
MNLLSFSLFLLRFVIVFCLNNTPYLFVGQIFICGNHYSLYPLYQYWHAANCTVELISSFRSSPIGWGVIHLFIRIIRLILNLDS